MRVLVTGGTGQIGKATVERLLQNGWDVRVLDLAPDVEIPGAEYVQCNILDYDDLLRHMRGCDTVIHLAAIRAPMFAPGQEVFQVNVAGTFNVFEAAATLGIRRVVQASSINALGAYYHLSDIQPHYFPIDEDHPLLTTDPYSFSKQIIEDIGAYYWRRDGISSVAIRYPGVYRGGSLHSENSRKRRDTMRTFLDELASQPESTQRERLADVKKRVVEFRRQRPLEFHPDQSPAARNPYPDDLLFAAYHTDRFNFWASVDERDAAQSLEKSLTADYEGAHVLFINDSSNYLDYDSRTLVRLFFPEVSQISDNLTGSSALVSIERARKLIGFEPEFSIKNTVQS